MSSSIASTNCFHEATRTTSVRRDPAWEYSECRVLGNTAKLWCKLCNKEMSGGITRAKEHLIGKKGNVTSCPVATPEIKKKILNYVTAKRESKAEKRRLSRLFEGNGRFLDGVSEEEQIQILEGAGGSSTSSHKVKKLCSSERSPLDLHTKVDVIKTEPIQLEHNKPFKEQEKKDAWKAIAEWAYEAGIPLDAFKLPIFQTALHAIGEYGMGMEVPSHYHLRTTLLKEVLEERRKFVESFKPHWKRCGCSIMFDFWTDGKGRSMINLLVNCNVGTVFLKSIDASELVKDANLLVEMIDEAIKEVGEDNIIQFITDIDSNYKLAGDILEEKYPKLFWSPCAAHCCNLILQDIGEKIPKIKNVLVEARFVVVYIYNHGRVLSFMRKFTGGNGLYRSCVNWSASQFYSLESLQSSKNALRMMFLSDHWTKSDFAQKVGGQKITKIVQKVSFWRDVDFAIGIMEPLVKVFRMLLTEDKPFMGYIYEAMDRAKEEIQGYLELNAKSVEAKKQAKEMKNLLWEIIDKRWDHQLHRPLHAAALYLNPHLYYKQSGDSNSLEENEDVQSGLRKVLDRLVPDEQEKDKVYSELKFYREGTRSFGSSAAIRLRDRMSPADWWITFGSSAPTLQKVAKRVLSQTCRASQYEQTWSLFDNMHSKKRNCLLQKKLNELVFIRYNTKLERQFNARMNDEDTSDPICLREMDENDVWLIPSDEELQDFVTQGDDLTWSRVTGAMGPPNEGPSTKNRGGTQICILDDDGEDEVQEHEHLEGNQESRRHEEAGMKDFDMDGDDDDMFDI